MYMFSSGATLMEGQVYNIYKKVKHIDRAAHGLVHFIAKFFRLSKLENS